MHNASFNFASYSDVLKNWNYFNKLDPDFYGEFRRICFDGDWNSLRTPKSLDDICFNLIDKRLAYSCVCSTPTAGYRGNAYGYACNPACDRPKICCRCSSLHAAKELKGMQFSSNMYYVTINNPELLSISSSDDVRNAFGVIYPKLAQNVLDATHNSKFGGCWIAREVGCVSLRKNKWNFHIHTIFKGDRSLLSNDSNSKITAIKNEEGLRQCVFYSYKPLQGTVLNQYKQEYDPSVATSFNRITERALDRLLEGFHCQRQHTSAGCFRG